ncbi:MAG: hypothetical protein UV71_C0001G0098 [Microgenomates group bacterium GW2011_GWC1_43_13]|nr:MAG: hypothetical protein UV71_C0001G0098 [Microgenomates group bacterium GW2011_GWC1_43_13]KKT32842.1 MAG: hypothetical protein UW20_C0008G0016 [Candidatus Woesebacteria bacterium GW2011_GWB1_44_11]KKT54639.1 MAG: hypothetical protein UW47_C0004G0046 [Candidatus Woesebacteria bacterium GW2011_GWA1_44_23]
MSPENPNFQIGGVTRLVANEISGQVASGFFQPESKTNTPDIRMQLTGEEEDENAKKDKDEQEYRKRHQYREGQTQLEIISSSTERHQLIDAERTFMNGFEDMSLHPDGSVSEYRLEDAIAVVGNRKADMSYSKQDLLDLGYLKQLQNPQTGKVEERLTFPGFGYTMRIENIEQHKKILTPDGTVHHIEIEEMPIQVYVPGTDEQREALRNDLYQVQSEMTAREDLVKKLRWVWNQTENLEGLVQFYFMGSLTQESMNSLCNAEGRTIPSEQNNGERIGALTRTEGGAEYRKGHEFGDATSVALQCFEIAALSEKPAELEILLKRPGIKFLFKVSDQEVDDLFLEPGQRGGRQLNPTLVKWIGEPWNWDRTIKSLKENVKNENKKGLRGLLTKHGNTLVESSWNDVEDIFEQVERFLGGGNDRKVVRRNSLAQKDARDARYIAWAELRVTAMASDLGGQLYHYPADKYLDRPEGNYVAHEMGGMTSCDRVKVIYPNIFRNIYRYIKTERRSYGPDGSIGKYPDRFTVPYFKSWVGQTERGKRTFQEMRWGYRAGQEVDLLTGKLVNLPEEKAYRLGELPWRSLGPKAYNAAALGPFIAGREKVGIFQNVMRTDFQIHELKDKAFFEKLAQFTGICFNLQTIRDGKLRGVYDGVKPVAPGEKSHDDKVDETVKPGLVRNYKKKFFTAFWDGIRSLPQYREWRAERPDVVDSFNAKYTLWPIERIKYRLGRIGVFTPEEAKNLPSEPLNNKDTNY